MPAEPVRDAEGVAAEKALEATRQHSPEWRAGFNEGVKHGLTAAPYLADAVPDPAVTGRVVIPYDLWVDLVEAFTSHLKDNEKLCDAFVAIGGALAKPTHLLVKPTGLEPEAVHDRPPTKSNRDTDQNPHDDQFDAGNRESFRRPSQPVPGTQVAPEHIDGADNG